MIIKLYNGKNWSIRPRVKINMDILLHDLITSEMDVVILIDGYEGTGKSFAARGLGMYCATVVRSVYPNTTFSPEDISFDVDTYIKGSVLSGKPDQNNGKIKINVLDEGRNAANRKRSNSRQNLRFTNYLSECRALRQIHIILLPAYHDIDKYIVMWRSSLLIHFVKNYTKDEESFSGTKLLRGEYKLFTDKSELATKYEFPYQYPARYEERNQWSNQEVFTKEELEEYENKKYAATLEKYTQEENEKEKNEELEKQVENVEYLPVGMFAYKMNVSRVTAINWINRGKIKATRIGNRWLVDINEFKRSNNGQGEEQQ